MKQARIIKNIQFKRRLKWLATIKGEQLSIMSELKEHNSIIGRIIKDLEINYCNIHAIILN